MSGLLNRVQSDLQAAMKAREAEKLSALRLLKSDLQYEMTKTGVSTLDDSQVQTIIQKAVRKRQESLVELEKAARTEEVAEENRAIAFLKEYLPAEATDKEIESVIEAVMQEAGADADFGKIMGLAMARLKGRADGARVRALVEASFRGHGN